MQGQVKSGNTKATLSLDERTWLDFKAACIRRKLTPGAVLTALMQAQLDAWNTETTKSSKGDHQ